MNEWSAGQVFEGVEDEVLGALDVARIPARIVKRRPSPAQRLHERSNSYVGHLVNCRCVFDDAVECHPRLLHESLVIWPSRLHLPAVAGHTPIPVGRVITEDVAHSGTVEFCGRTADEIEVDVHGLRHGPADIPDDSVHTNGGTLGERRVDGHGSGYLKERHPPLPGDVLGRVQSLAAAQADHGIHLRQRGHVAFDLAPLHRAHQERADVPVVEGIGETRPQVGHRGDDVRPVNVLLEFVHQPATVDGREELSHEGLLLPPSPRLRTPPASRRRERRCGPWRRTTARCSRDARAPRGGAARAPALRTWGS